MFCFDQVLTVRQVPTTRRHYREKLALFFPIQMELISSPSISSFPLIVPIKKLPRCRVTPKYTSPKHEI